MTDWQPIETAPRDGTPVLLGRFHAGDPCDGRISVDWWRSGGKYGFVGFGEFNAHYWPATHWMPLPDPPAKQTYPTPSPAPSATGSNRK